MESNVIHNFEHLFDKLKHMNFHKIIFLSEKEIKFKSEREFNVYYRKT